MFKFGKTEVKTKTKVLVIDDEASFTRMVKLNLEDMGTYEVETLNESSKTLEMVQTFEPDIVLLDVVMPEFDGGDVATTLRSRSATKDTPIIFLSAIVAQA